MASFTVGEEGAEEAAEGDAGFLPLFSFSEKWRGKL
jgi:hypothetical protein